ncbi:glycine betaine ABC transporter substrate-binding protein [Candidatus Enterococcus willemsii]|uniref:Glycine/betaine ABC transporter n=1 Tax=Candidatus Enterococcus willemsii TaxID=1857215 RepID=A0ABQ6Z156_9ENTE|nr:glycine betaine ABC transporter substrate-binding protein [Enterococcus sp. CU12B]KAF1305115.1 glycine/betaine ABC transporter [Enterococcus sp. CU12B]
MKLKAMGLLMVSSILLLFTGCSEQKQVSTDNIEEFVDYTITGVEPGAGITDVTKETLASYDNLSGWTLQESSTAGMLSEVEQAIKKEEPIIFTGWTPHWMFEKYDLKMLEDPKKAMGEVEEIHTIARRGLKEDHPGVYQIIDQFNWELADMQVMVSEGLNRPYDEIVSEWIEENGDQVSEWTKGVSKGNGESVEMVSVQWDTELASSELVKQVLENHGYSVKVTDVEPAIMFQSVASGQADFSVAPWLPSTHKAFYDKYSDDLDDLGANLVGAQNGLTVPAYMDIDSIEELQPKP